MILVIDNYDSFAFNLARYFERLGQPTRVVRNDSVDAAEVEAMNPTAIVLSPGPCGPKEAGNSLAIVRSLWQQKPMLGICLGHQTIAAAFGADIIRTHPMHGRTSEVFHNGAGVFQGVANPFDACRYHSLIVDEHTLPPEFQITARTVDGVVMAIAHETRPIVGVQFHPESILTEPGYQLLANFLTLAGSKTLTSVPRFDEELHVKIDEAILPDVPVTF